MGHVTGIRFEKDNHGVKRYIRIDLNKYGKEIEPFLKKLNIEIDEQFENDWEQSLTPNQFKSQMHSRIKNWFDK
ncbi:MAG: hypothetical protein ACM3O8_15035 [Methylococcaceae bacterium]|nr:hypothetical protein [Prolixibacteraceae bacterium]